jgi:hypothetical protein
MYVDACSFYRLPAAMLLDTLQRPSRKGKEGGTTVLEAIPSVVGQGKWLALWFQPWVEGRLVHGEDVVVRGVGDKKGEDDEGIEGRWEKGDKSPSTFLISFWQGHPHVFFGEEDVAPAKEEDFTWTNKGEEAECEEGVMVELEGGLGGEEEVEVFDGDPELRTGTAVDAAVRAKSIRGEGGEGRGNTINSAPEFDGRSGGVRLPKGESIREAEENEGVEGVGREGREGEGFTVLDVLVEVEE